MMATPKTDVAHGLPIDIVILAYELQQVPRDVGKQKTSNGIQH